MSASGRDRGPRAIALLLAAGLAAACSGGAGQDEVSAGDVIVARADREVADTHAEVAPDGADPAATAEGRAAGPGRSDAARAEGSTGPDDAPSEARRSRPRPTEPPTFREGGVLEEAFDEDNPFPDFEMDCLTEEDFEVVGQVLGPDAVEEFEDLVEQGYLERC
ncbi:hypothetical protein [Egicoccus sp. AB-alg2]|uniref:hypothetical protein n=1 Tax=Egicoccus sp. AB-alg2 TaxID=3242693 RepID=UPI00359E01D9